MDFFKKSRDRVLQTIGLADKPPKDSGLAASMAQLDKLDSMVTAMQHTVEGYARSMLAVGDATKSLAADVGKFYRKSEQRQKSIQQFLSAMADQESNLLFLYKEQFGWDVQRELDLWHESIRVLRERIRSADEQHSGMETLRHKVESGRAGGKRVDEEDARLKQVAKSYAALAAEITRDVEAAIEGRFARFDQVFIRILECQREYFQESLENTEKFTPLIATYRKRVPLPGAAAAPADKPEPEPEAKKASSSSVPKDVQAAAPKQQPAPAKQPEPVAAKPPAAAPAAAKPPAAVAPKPAEPAGELDLFFSAPSSPVSPNPAALPAGRSSDSIDLLSSFASSGATSPAAAAPPAAAKPATVDLLGGFFGGDSSSSAAAPVKPAEKPAQKPQQQQQASGGASMLDLFGSHGGSSGAHSSKPAGGNHGDGFDMFFSAGAVSSGAAAGRSSNAAAATSSSASAPAARRPPVSMSGAGGVDDVDDDVSSPTGAGSSAAVAPADDVLSAFSGVAATPSGRSNTAGSSNGGGFSFDPLDDDFSAPSAPKPSVSAQYAGGGSNSGGSGLPTAAADTAEDIAMVNALKSQYEYKVHQWRYKSGVEKKIGPLLASLPTVLWEGNDWQRVDITQLLDYNAIKRSYRKALMMVHPDKVSAGTPQMKATAELVFDVLNAAFKNYEIEQGLRAP
jgi:hypothetical protein